MNSLGDVITQVKEATHNVKPEFRDQIIVAAALCYGKGDIPEEFDKWLACLIRTEVCSGRSASRHVTATVSDVSEETLLEKEGKRRVFINLTKSLPDHIKSALSYLTKDPEGFAEYMRSNAAPKNRMLVSFVLRCYYAQTGQASRRSLFMSPDNINKQKAASMLYANHPDLFVLLMACGSVEALLEVVSVLQGQTIQIPTPEDLAQFVDIYNGKKIGVVLGVKENVTYQKTLNKFLSQSIKTLTGASIMTEEAVSERTKTMDTQALLRLYRMLSSTFTQITKEGAA